MLQQLKDQNKTLEDKSNQMHKQKLTIEELNKEIDKQR